MGTSEILTLFFSGIVAISTVTYAVFTYKLTKQTRLSREFQIEAHIVAYLANLETDPTAIRLIIKNVGKGVAKNVKFEIKKDIEYESGYFQKLENLGIFQEGIKYLPSNKEFNFSLTNFTENSEIKLNDFIEFNVMYSDYIKVSRKQFFRLPFKELNGLSKRTPPETYIGMISYRLEKIERILERYINDKTK